MPGASYLLLLVALIVMPPTALGEPLLVHGVADEVAVCCKVCSRGEACGDNCIARRNTCHQPPGCACDAR